VPGHGSWAPRRKREQSSDKPNAPNPWSLEESRETAQNRPFFKQERFCYLARNVSEGLLEWGNLAAKETVQVRIWAYVENLELGVHPYLDRGELKKLPYFELSDNLRIRRTLESERRELYRSVGRDPDRGFSIDIDCKSSVIESCVHAEPPIQKSDEYHQAERRISLAFAGLLLYFEKLAKARTKYHAIAPMPHIEKNAAFAKQIPPLWASLVSDLDKFPFRVMFRDLEKFKKFWIILDRVAKPFFLLRSIRWFNAAVQLAGEEDIDRLIYYVTSMEALVLTREPEASYKLALRLAVLQGGPSEDIQNVFDFIKEMYDVRSAIVHGGTSDVVEIRRGHTKVNVDFDEALGRMHAYCCRSIRRMILLLDGITQVPELSDEWSNLKDDVKKTRVVQLLDYVLLRPDLRAMFEAFMNGVCEVHAFFTYYRKEVEAEFYPTLLAEKNAKRRKRTITQRRI
jgi:hypothetical protein